MSGAGVGQMANLNASSQHPTKTVQPESEALASALAQKQVDQSPTAGKVAKVELCSRAVSQYRIRLFVSKLHKIQWNLLLSKHI